MLVLPNVTMELPNVRKKNKGITKCDKRTVTCDVGTAQCEDETIKCDVLVIWYNKLLISGYRTSHFFGGCHRITLCGVLNNTCNT